MNRSATYAIAGITSIIGGIVLNAFAIWLALLPYQGVYPPPPQPIIIGTVFLLLIPVGAVLLMYAIYIFASNYRITISRKENDSVQLVLSQ